jgi:hypothetical protein
MKILRSQLIIGIIVALLTFTLSMVISRSFALKISGTIGGGLLFLAFIFSGSLNSGDRLRANYSRENNQEREERFNLAGIFFKLGLPSIALCIFWYFVP